MLRQAALPDALPPPPLHPLSMMRGSSLSETTTGHGAASTPPRTPKPTLSEQIRSALVERIVSGELTSGHRLVETRLAAEFGTSQAPVREALRGLEKLGLVENRPRHGTYVLPFVEQTLREAYVVRAAMEEAATRLVMLRGTAPIDLLEGDVADMARSASVQDTRAMALASTRFHRHVIEAADNKMLTRWWESLYIEARTAITLMVVQPELTEVTAEHAELLDFMRSGDIDSACRHAREHQWAYAQFAHEAHG